MEKRILLVSQFYRKLHADRRNAERLGRHPHVDARIDWLLTQRGVKLRISEDAIPDASRHYVLRALVENAEIALGRRTVTHSLSTSLATSAAFFSVNILQRWFSVAIQAGGTSSTS